MGRKATDAKERIIKAAVKLFAKEGFEKTRVDDIAKNAKVNKALIYYYFKSKVKILDYILEGIFHEILDFESEALRKTHTLPQVSLTKDKITDIEAYLKTYIKFLTERKEVVKILYMESFTAHSPQILLSYIDRDFIKGIEDMKKKYNIQPKDVNLVKLQSFFLGYIPLFMFVIMKENWCTHYDMSENEVEDQFIKIFAQEFMVDTLTRLFD